MDLVCKAVGTAKEVEDAGKRRAILLSACGSETYALARDLLQPAKSEETTFKKIVDTLEKHFLPKPSEIVERFIAEIGKTTKELQHTWQNCVS